MARQAESPLLAIPVYLNVPKEEIDDISRSLLQRERFNSANAQGKVFIYWSDERG
jgi:hypothetical protein